MEALERVCFRHEQKILNHPALLKPICSDNSQRELLLCREVGTEAALRIMRVPQTGRLLICIKAQSLNFVNCQL